MLLTIPPRYAFLIAVALGLTNCHTSPKAAKEEDASTTKTPTLFTLLSPQQTHLEFTNALTEGLNTNVMMYEYFYNGGGVAIGDVNNDGLPDIYFTGNMTSNRLYLNRKNLQFEDVTGSAGVAGREGPWKTGVTMADVNGDGLLDIYVCYSGNLRPEKRTNELFINQGADANGLPRFTEEAKAYGLDSPAASTQGAFFDYDRDGDLDMFLLNHNPKMLPILDEASTAELVRTPDPMTGVRLYRNDQVLNHSARIVTTSHPATRGTASAHFTDITEEAGLSSSALTYGLGVGIADLNGDNWPDLYISNDYSVPDYLYINNQRGPGGKTTFSNQLSTSIGHTSQFSMGNDVADVNNDGLPDIFTLDMLPEDNKRQKLLFAPDNYEKFDLNVRTGFYYQYMRNMLQVNNGTNRNGLPTFSEIGQLAGIANTDWSWAPLFADYDNDGWKDLYITNGYTRDYTNLDFMKYRENYVQQKGRLMRNDVLTLVQQMPSSQVNNYVFRNEGGLTFSNAGKEWGLAQPSNSNGAAYADLDNDGDLDLVVNNINQPAFLYRNEAQEHLKHHYLQVKLEGAGLNTQGLGAKVTVYAKGKLQYQEQMPTRGYQSSVSPVLHFGLGKEASIDSVRIIWLSGKAQLIKSVPADQLLTLREKEANTTSATAKPAVVCKPLKSVLAFTHQAVAINDFKRQPLLVNPQSDVGPCLVKGDVNGDGLEDIYVGGSTGQAGAIYLQQHQGQFKLSPQPAFDADKASKDTDALFFDADGDHDVDLYVCSGGYDSFLPNDSLLQDRLYRNDGKGNFVKHKTALPTMRTSTSCVRTTDVNGDSFADLFVGGRVVPGRYPETPTSYLLINDTKGNFTDHTSAIAPALQNIGLVSDAAWLDLDGDTKKELLVIGEWMPLRVFGYANGKFVEQTKKYIAKEYRGFWNKLLVADFNGDGKEEWVAGNLGLNSQCKASEKEPAELFYKDFDDNGSVDPMLCFYIQGKSYPYVTRDELLDQISLMRTRFGDYASYANASMKDIFTSEELQGVMRLEANYLNTAYFERNQQGKFVAKSLPIEAQFAPVYALSALDYDHDGKQDLLLAGNAHHTRLRLGKADANYGQLFKGDGRGGFTYVPPTSSGLQLKGDVRSILTIGNILLFGLNGQAVEAYQFKKP